MKYILNKFDILKAKKLINKYLIFLLIENKKKWIQFTKSKII